MDIALRNKGDIDIPRIHAFLSNKIIEDGLPGDVLLLGEKGEDAIDVSGIGHAVFMTGEVYKSSGGQSPREMNKNLFIRSLGLRFHWARGLAVMTSPLHGECHQFKSGRAQFFLSPSRWSGKEKPGKKKCLRQTGGFSFGS